MKIECVTNWRTQQSLDSKLFSKLLGLVNMEKWKECNASHNRLPLNRTCFNDNLKNDSISIIGEIEMNFLRSSIKPNIYINLYLLSPK